MQFSKNEISIYDNVTGVLNTEIKTGDILVRRAKVPGFIHFGIAVVQEDKDDFTIKVYHNSPRRRRIAFESLEEYLEGKPLRRIDGNVGIESPSELADLVLPFSNRSFNWLTWNCEHFIKSVAGKEVKSPQVRNSIALAFALLVFTKI